MILAQFAPTLNRLITLPYFTIMSTPQLQTRVHSMRYEAQGILSLELRPTSSEVIFPAYEPGSHIDLHLGNGLIRSYSLLNPSAGDQRYVVGVLNDRNSRGGSRYVHEQLRVGAILPISVPRNNFKLHENVEHSVLVAGGIGVTPIYCMLQRLIALGRKVDLIYCARTRSEAAFVNEITALVSESVNLTMHFDDEQMAPPQLDQLLASYSADAHLYCCGPTPMLDAFEKTCDSLGYENAHVERFTAVHVTPSTADVGYVVELKRNGKIIEIAPGQSILDKLIEEGISLDYSCKEGVCGSCETKIISGDVEHLDSILTKSEKTANKSMMVCVSRCRGGTLVLDL